MANPKAKGSRIEREIVNLLKEEGLDAKRVPLSGAAEGFKGDILLGDDKRIEVKSRRSGEGFKTLEKWLGDNNYLVLRRDRAKPIVVMPWEEFICLLQR